MGVGAFFYAAGICCRKAAIKLIHNMSSVLSFNSHLIYLRLDCLKDLNLDLKAKTFKSLPGEQKLNKTEAGLKSLLTLNI